MPLRLIAALALMLLVQGPARAETPEEWVGLGTRIHGFFGGFIPVGVRIGLDAVERLRAGPRGLAFTYYQGASAPCPCIADGIMLATDASPGQGTERLAAEPAPPGALAVVVIRNRKTGEGLRYTVDDTWLPKILGWNKLPPLDRFQEAMGAEGLFSVTQAAP